MCQLSSEDQLTLLKVKVDILLNQKNYEKAASTISEIEQVTKKVDHQTAEITKIDIAFMKFALSSQSKKGDGEALSNETNAAIEALRCAHFLQHHPWLFSSIPLADFCAATEQSEDGRVSQPDPLRDVKMVSAAPVDPLECFDPQYECVSQYQNGPVCMPDHHLSILCMVSHIGMKRYDETNRDLSALCVRRSFQRLRRMTGNQKTFLFF